MDGCHHEEVDVIRWGKNHVLEISQEADDPWVGKRVCVSVCVCECGGRDDVGAC